MRWTQADAHYAGVVYPGRASDGARVMRRLYVANRALTCGGCGRTILQGEDFSPNRRGFPTCATCYPWIKE